MELASRRRPFRPRFPAESTLSDAPVMQSGGEVRGQHRADFLRRQAAVDALDHAGVSVALVGATISAGTRARRIHFA
jgi:hypothetical protein